MLQGMILNSKRRHRHLKLGNNKGIENVINFFLKSTHMKD
jgi:hypothetical protein